MVLLFHLTDFAAPLPSDWLHSWRVRLYTLSHLDVPTKLRRCRHMLELVRQHYRLVDPSQLLANFAETSTETSKLAARP